MTREIKFRAWDKGEKLMFDVYAMDWASKGEIITCHSSSKKYYPEMEVGDKIVFMQYTGLKDKNGKEIYEGDILKVSYRDRRIAVGMGVKPFEGEDKWSEWKESFVEIYTEPAMWLCRYTKTHGYHGHLVTINAHTKECGGSLEIIGNIYENPELLKANT